MTTEELGLAASTLWVVIAAVISMIFKLPHPLWLVVGGLVLPIPVALLAVRLVYRRSTLPRVP